MSVRIATYRWVGDCWGQSHLKTRQYVEYHLPAGRRRGVEPIEIAIHRVSDVMIDVDDEVLVQACQLGSIERPALKDYRGVKLAIDGIPDLDVGYSGKRRKIGWDRIVADDTDFFSQTSECQGYC